MERVGKLIDYLEEALQHPEISGFELLEYLDVRSRLAIQEPLLNQVDKVRVESIDRQFLRNGQRWLELILDICDLSEMRQKVRVLPSHWWWYLDEIMHDVTAVSCTSST